MKSLAWVIGLAFFSAISWGADGSQLQVGASKVDITPPIEWGLRNAWGTKLDGVHDPVFVRAIYLASGQNEAAIIAIDTVGNDQSDRMLAQIEKEVHIPSSHVILVSTHDHNGPRIGAGGRSGQTQPPGLSQWLQKVTDAVVDATKAAKSKAKPAKMGIGTGYVDINVNRDFFAPDGTWKLGVNPTGPSDKTVWVIKFETESGDPIALFTNYAVHDVVMGPENTKITGDLSEAAMSFVERQYGDKLVALWTSGPAGDQNPKYMSWDTTYGGKNTQSNDEGFRLNDALGRMLGEEVFRTASSMKAETDNVRISASDTVVTCPGKNQTRGPSNTPAPPAATAPPDVQLYLGMLMLNDIAIGGVQSEIVDPIYEHLRHSSPYRNTIMVTHDHGSMGYIPEDAAYDRPTFEVTGSRFRRGCAESSIVGGLVDLMRK
jgi:hypothetical protein